jgi:hypothetical protein
LRSTVEKPRGVSPELAGKAIIEEEQEVVA